MPSRRKRSARSEYRASAPAAVDVRQLAFQLLSEMQTQQRAARLSFGELAMLWLACLRRVGGTDNERRHVEHLKPIHAFREGELSVSHIDAVLLNLETSGALGSGSLNKLRSTGKLVIDYAQANNQWSGINPFQKVKRRRVAKKPYTRLTLDELERAFAKLRPDRRRMARVSLFIGVRPGELFALQKCDVDLERGFLSVHRSHERDETKTGRSRDVPIPTAVLEDMREAMRASPCDLVFPTAEGKRQRRDTKLARMLRHGLRLAGVCTGWRYACRRRGCGFKEELPMLQVRRECPKCSWALLSIGIPKHFTYYDLRHACSTLHREAGADALAVKIALGHAPRDVNDSTYTHLSDEMLRTEMDRLGEKR